MNIDLELFKRYFLNTHFNYKDKILYITNEIHNDKPIYIIIHKDNSETPFYYEKYWILGDYNNKYKFYQDYKTSNNNSLIPPFDNWYNCWGILQEDIKIFKIYDILVKKTIKFYPLYIKNICKFEKDILLIIILILKKNEIPKEIIEYIITFFRRIDILKLSN